MDAPRMSRRGFAFAVAAASALPAIARAQAHRARHGASSLEGIWTNASYTRLERPPAFKTLSISPQAAAQAEATYARTGSFAGDIDPLGQRDSEFGAATGAGLARVRGEVRTSWIVDPPDGRLPFTAEAIKRFQFDNPQFAAGFDNPEDQTVTTRCVASENGGAPSLNGPDGNFLRIVQVPGYVLLLAEKYNDLRIVRLRDTAHQPAHQPAIMQSWLGDPVGRWEGETLVVESTNLCPSTPARYGRLKVSPATTVVERFTRVSSSELFYEFTVTDPSLYTRPWRAEMPFHAATGPMYEYACHEGNYGMTNILAGARAEERKAAAR